MAQTKPLPQRSIRILNWNANSIWNQLHTFKSFLKEQNIDIALINETHLKHYHTFKIPNYQIIRTDRPGLKGGTAIIIKSQLPYDNLVLPQLQTLEATGIQLYTKGKPIICRAAYIKPGAQLITNDFLLLKNLGPKILIAGDER